MKFEDVQKLHDQLDCRNGAWDEDDHFYMQAYAVAKDELLVVRFGEYRDQAYLFWFPVSRQIPDSREQLTDCIDYVPICSFEGGVLYAGMNYYDLPEHPEPYDPNSGEAGVLDVDMGQDWKLSDVQRLERAAEEHASVAAYELECYQKALDVIRNNESKLRSK